MAGRSGGRVGQSWRRFQRRPLGVRIASIVLIVVIVAGIAYAVSAGPSSSAKKPTRSHDS